MKNSVTALRRQQEDLAGQLEKDGYAVVPDVLSTAEVKDLRQLIDAALARDGDSNVANRSGSYALRNLTDVVPQTATLVHLPNVRTIVEAVLGRRAFMVRATLFDKTPGANWGVFWHRDLSIAVQKRHSLPDFHAWTRKAGVHCVHPPIDIMDRIVALRLHLDDCDEANGALRILPGTHRRLSLSQADIEQLERDDQQVRCDVPAGGAMLMKPLVLHASSPMTTGSGRRVIHFEFAASELPKPLDWKYRIYCDRTVHDGVECDG